MRGAHSGAVEPVGELLRRKRGDASQEAVSQSLGVGQSRYQRWETMLVDIDADRDLHSRLRGWLEMDPEPYAQAALEHSIRVKERRK